MACLVIFFQLSLFFVFALHSVIPISLKSSSTSAFHLVHGLHFLLLPPIPHVINILGTFPSLVLSTCPSYLTRCVLTTPVIFVACYLLVCSPSPYFAHLSFPTPPQVLFFQSYSGSTFRMRIRLLVVSPSRRS
jgi:hypothetical protein